MAGLKNLRLKFQSVLSLNDPFIANKKVHRSYQETTLSESEFEQALIKVYDNLEPHIKSMVTWEYYLDQAKQNKKKIEPSLIAAKAPPSPLPDASQYAKVCCLRLFPNLQLDTIWERYGENHTGLAIELDTEHEYFTASRYDALPQIFQAVQYDDLRPPFPSKQMPFPAAFSRPEHAAYEKESRLLRLLQSPDQSEVFKIPKAVIKAIYLGLNCPTALTEEVVQLVKLDLQFRHVKLKQMAVSETHLRLQPLDLADYL